MAFKLGRARKFEASGGEVMQKLSFKNEQVSIPGTPVIRKNLEPGIMGEANMDGSIYISNEIQPGSKEENQVLLLGCSRLVLSPHSPPSPSTYLYYTIDFWRI